MPKTLEEVIAKYLDSVFICPEEEIIGDSKNIADAIRQWIKERLPKEMERVKPYHLQENIAIEGYNQALKDVRQSLGEE